MSILQSLLFTPNFMRDPPAFFHPRILVGPGAFLTPYFVQKHGITHVINCAHDDFSPSWWRRTHAGKYRVIEAVDDVNVNILDWYPPFESTLQSFLREGNGVVYVHCQAGMNRSASLALAYTCKNLGMNFDELVSSVRQQRPCVLRNPVFMNQVREFVNGRVQDPENTGAQFFNYYDRYSGFFAPGDSTESKGDEDQTGAVATGIRRTTSGNITPIPIE